MNRKGRDDASGGEGSFGRPFDVKDSVEDIESTSGDAHDGSINDWEPIARLKDLLRKIFPTRMYDEKS